MTGKTHKAIGLCTGITTGFWCAQTFAPVDIAVDIGLPLPYFGGYLPTMAVCLAAAAAGAMLPDIDHDRSKIGALRKTAMRLLMATYGLLFVVACKLLYDRWMYLELAMLILLVALPGLVLPLWTKTKIGRKWGRKLPRISFKHRGIMHTLVMPALVLLWAYHTPDGLLRMALIATATGYLSHLLLDCLTKRGCPILWPLYPKNLSILPISTGTPWEYLCSFPVGAGILSLSLFFWP